MATIQLTTPIGGICNGKLLTFNAPVGSEEITSLSVAGIDFEIVDANGKALDECGIVFAKDSMITVALDIENRKAVLNSDAFLSSGDSIINAKDGKTKIKIWVGNQEEKDAIGETDPNTLYFCL